MNRWERRKTIQKKLDENVGKEKITKERNIFEHIENKTIYAAKSQSLRNGKE